MRISHLFMTNKIIKFSVLKTYHRINVLLTKMEMSKVMCGSRFLGRDIGF